MVDIRRGEPIPLGGSRRTDGIQFAVSLPGEKECKLKLYGKEQGEEISLILDEKYRKGSIFTVLVNHLPYEIQEYVYEVKNKEVLDPYAEGISGREVWGTVQMGVRCKMLQEEFNWKQDVAPCIPYEDMVLYQLHVRGFTMHSSSGVKSRGTFRGLMEKIPYLKQLGVNAVMLLPCYEFDEIMKNEAKGTAQKHFLNYKDVDPSLLEKEELPGKINYWGYTSNCCYFAPKASYASNPFNPVGELKELIRTFHENQMEVHMEFHFEKKSNQLMIVECLRHWALEYHVDGFRVNGDTVLTGLLAGDPVLDSVKLFTEGWQTDHIYSGTVPEQKRLAEYNDGFLVDARRFLKGDEEQVEKFLYRMKKNPAQTGVINYITQISGFTLMDLVSYDIKHNEANGENGRDGTDYNYSWNCGAEGKSKKKTVVSLRRQQIRNAFLMLLLSQGTPMILSGDEFGNSSQGNNNAYCQDNEISWLNWNQLKTHKDIFEYVRFLLELRRAHPILHRKDEFRLMDYIACGYPDLSIHGTRAWYPDFSNYSRVLGIMLCGRYEIMARRKNDNYFYFAFNMHWETHEFDLPKLPERMRWEILTDTAVTVKEEAPLENQKSYLVKPRSTVVFLGS